MQAASPHQEPIEGTELAPKTAAGRHLIHDSEHLAIVASVLRETFVRLCWGKVTSHTRCNHSQHATMYKSPAELHSRISGCLTGQGGGSGEGRHWQSSTCPAHACSLQRCACLGRWPGARRPGAPCCRPNHLCDLAIYMQPAVCTTQCERATGQMALQAPACWTLGQVSTSKVLRDVHEACRCCIAAATCGETW